MRRCNDYSSHTSFNAGAGEECLTYILDILLNAAEGSFICIEEIEVGLHPATMERLIDSILDISRERLLQVVITTHSPEFLRSAPRQCVVLAERVDPKVQFTQMPNIENAVYCLSDKANIDLYIVCEDEVAARFIRKSLLKRQRDIVRIEGYGSKDDLIGKAEGIKLATGKDVLIIWDGDVSDSYLTKPILAEKKIHAMKFLGTDSLERYIIDSINKGDVKERIMAKYGLEEADWVELLRVINTLRDHHDVFYSLAQKLNCSTADAVCDICDIVHDSQKSDFDSIRSKVANLLGGDTTVGKLCA